MSSSISERVSASLKSPAPWNMRITTGPMMASMSRWISLSSGKGDEAGLLSHFINKQMKRTLSSQKARFKLYKWKIKKGATQYQTSKYAVVSLLY